MEVGQRKLAQNPRKSASLISKLFFGWSIPIFKSSYGIQLHPNDAFAPLDEDHSKILGDRLEKAWEAESKYRERPRLVRAVFKAFWREIVFLGIICLLADPVTNLCTSIALKELLIYFQENGDSSREGAYKYGISIVFLILCFGMGFLHFYYFSSYYAMRIRVALSSLVYRKALRLSQKSLSETAPGKLVNLLSNDVNRFDTLLCLHPL